MSKPAPCGRATPRISLEGAPFGVPVSMQGLPIWSWRLPGGETYFGSALMQPAPAVATVQLVPLPKTSEYVVVTVVWEG